MTDPAATLALLKRVAQLAGVSPEAVCLQFIYARAGLGRDFARALADTADNLAQTSLGL